MYIFCKKIWKNITVAENKKAFWTFSIDIIEFFPIECYDKV